MKPKSILIIDGDVVTAEIYRKKFQDEGFAASVASDSNTGLKMLAHAPVDLVLLDLVLPGISGLDVLQLIRSNPETQNLPVFIFSNTYLGRLVQAAYKAGATKCLAKADCTPREVLEIVSKFFGLDAADTPTLNKHLELRRDGADLTLLEDQVRPPGRSEMMFQRSLVKNFFDQAPRILVTLRHQHQSFIQCSGADAKSAELNKLCRLAHSLAAAAGLIDYRNAARMASSFAALLHELSEKPEAVTFSMMLTLAHALDTLAALCGGTLVPDSRATACPLILIADDDAVSRGLIASALGKAGWHAVAVDNSSLALELIRQNRFDLIFLDIQMPAPDGFEVCTRLRQMPLNRKTPVVFVTVHTEFCDRARSSLCGGNDFIAKPFLLLELTVKAFTWLFRGELPSPVTPVADRAPKPADTPDAAPPPVLLKLDAL